jgi:ADP-ribosylglycohydrolase
MTTTAITESMNDRATCVQRILEAIAFGDACGLPWEGLDARVIPPIHGREIDLHDTMISDDTELVLLVLNALADPHLPFEDGLHKRFRRWIACAPPSLGGATLRAGIKALLGVRPSGVRSQGNGPLSRAAILGAAITPEAVRRTYVRASTTLTHTDPITVACAQMTAEIIAARIERRTPVVEPALEMWFGPLVDALNGVPWFQIPALRSIARTHKVSGHAPITLIAAVTCAEQSDTVREAVSEAIALGGDVDSTAALAAAFAAAAGGEAPRGWDAHLPDPVWKTIAPHIRASTTWPDELWPLRKRNGKQLLWALKKMFGSRLRARIS